MASLEIDRVKKRFGAQEILKGIDISVDTGEFLVLVGPSGCGKSTLLNMIAGVDTISEGEIRVAGARVNELHPSERDIAMVFQSYALYPNMTVEQNIGFSMEMHKVPKAERLAAVREVAKILQLEELLKRRPSQLSGGQRQRVGVARGLGADPPILLMDEPFGALDPVTRSELQREFSELSRRLGKTIVFVTHDLREALMLASRIVLLQNGRIVASGTPQKFLSIDHPEVRAFSATLHTFPGVPA